MASKRIGILAGGALAGMLLLGAAGLALAQALHQSSTRSIGGGSAAWGRRLLVTSQLALALVVVVAAGLSTRSAMAIRQVDLGFDHKDVLSGRIDLPESAYPEPESIRAFVTGLEQELPALPGAPPVGLGSHRPVLDGGAGATVHAEGQPDRREAAPLAQRISVSAGYFDTLGIPRLSGRPISDSDTPDGLQVALVSRTLAKRLFGDADPLGRRIRLGALDAADPWLTIVGTVGDVANPDLSEPPAPTVYVPLAQRPSRALAVFARTRDAAAVTQALRASVARLDGSLALYDARLISDVFWEELASDRVIVGMFAVFGLVALLLASVGLYGVVSYAASQRTAEIGVRMALGASRASVLRLVLTDGARMLGLGLIVGLALALAVARVMSSALFGVSGTDPVTLLGSGLVLLAVGGLASFLPARRAAGLDPIEALRAD